jgi:chloramphenicol 3-O phosphotransferase
MPFVIFLNGTGSVGKSSIALKLQDLMKEPTLRVGIDDFINMMPRDLLPTGKNAGQGFNFVSSKEGEHVITKVEVGPIGFKTSYAMHRAMKAILDSGFNLIIDDVVILDEFLQDYIQLFQDYTVYFIAIKAPIEVVTHWESTRDDRVPGMARGLYDDVYKNKVFDLEIDSSKMPPEQSAKAILQFIQAHPTPSAFKSNQKK